MFFGENVPRDRVDAVRPPLARADAVLTLKVEHEVGAALHALAAAPLRQPPSQTQQAAGFRNPGPSTRAGSVVGLTEAAGTEPLHWHTPTWSQNRCPRRTLMRPFS